MADSFQGINTIILQPGTATLPYTFSFPACTSATANDGAIPYNDTISSAEVKAFNENGTDRTTEVVVSESNTTTLVTVNLKYPAYAGTHTGAANAAILTDSTKSWTADELIGLKILNDTDGSEGTITDNDTTTVTVALSGGTDDDFDFGDAYHIELASGRYSLEFVLTLASGAVMEFDFTRIYAKDIAA